MVRWGGGGGGGGGGWGGGSTLHARYINNLMGSLGRWGERKGRLLCRIAREPLCRIIKMPRGEGVEGWLPYPNFKK